MELSLFRRSNVFVPVVKVQLELGGKDLVYVCDDVDVKAAAAGIADGAFYNTRGVMRLFGRAH